MKKAIILALGASIASCLALVAINQSNLPAKAHIASYLVKQHHIPRDDVRGILSNTTTDGHSIFSPYDDSF